MSDAARPWLFVGTVPEPDLPLAEGPFTLDGESLTIAANRCGLHRGTPAMLGAAFAAAPPGAMRQGRYRALVAGDTGRGRGSREVYAWLVDNLASLRPAGVTFHYLLPDVDWHNRILMAVRALPEPPLLVADAGFMYAAKMSGYADYYDLFTPDIGELAFLADVAAPHPFYTRNFLLADEDRVEELIGAAYGYGNAARHMLVKGKADRYVKGGRIEALVDGPDVPMLEPVGGTGDTLTGIVSALLGAGLSMGAACVIALRANRIMGKLAAPTPASGVGDLLPFIPEALQRAVNVRS